MDTQRRTVAKTLSWRVFATMITTSLTWVLTHELRFAATVGILDTILKLGSYYVHERAWNRLPFGLEQSADYEI